VNVQRLIVRASALAAVAALVAIVWPSGRSYEIKLRLSDALGLRNGSKVVEGGVQVGTVTLHLDRRDRVDAELSIDRRYAPIGRNATAQVTSLNLLGQKSLQLAPGDRRTPAPSGYAIPASRVTPATDLDQVLDVLGPDTRSRLTILIDEAGSAFVGRREDVSALLNELPSSLSAGARLLAQLNGDDRSLADLVVHSDDFITTLDTQRAALGRLVNTLGQTAVTVEPRDAALQSTLRRLPGTLRTAQRFLADLRRTTVPLGPAARDIQSVAPGLQSVLTQIAPFTRAARPALKQATTDAPELTALATRATPVLQASAPTLADLSTAGTDLAPVTHALSLSIDNIIATAWNWSHAVELRDGLSHLFRAEFTFTPKTISYLVQRLLGSGTKLTLPTLGATPGTSRTSRTDRLAASAVPPTSSSLSALLGYLTNP
jgi:phospholipid/cholesterol/gamma-HCH transport system substrate-binding protein